MTVPIQLYSGSPAEHVRPPQRKIEGIELLRFMLAFGVMIYHYAYFGPLSGKIAGVTAGPVWLVTGRFGVSAFFIISGFVIIYSASGRTALAFTRARLARLIPAMLVCATATAILLIAVPGTLPAPSLANWAKSASTIGLLAGAPYVDGSYWSITIELRFYLYVLLLLVILRSTDRIRVVAVCWMAASYLAMVLDNEFARIFTLSPHSGYFILGIVFYCWLILEDRRFVALTLGPTLLLCAWQSWVEFAHIAELSGGHSTPWAGIGAAIVSFLLVRVMAFGINGPTAAARARTLGAMSYPLYLLHQAIGYRLIERLVTINVPVQVAIGFCVTLMCAAAWLLAVHVEPAGRELIMKLRLPWRDTQTRKGGRP
jgi:peptidoglycan/LPS O-acetylase OafA/YrhL